nr:MAG TPA: hypothetical protein [Bacteriophage sp.]DAY13639.1 MAG TPA: hypothetical protein [Bacteriophage sp.]
MSSNIHSLFCTLITEYWLVKNNYNFCLTAIRH